MGATRIISDATDQVLRLRHRRRLSSPAPSAGRTSDRPGAALPRMGVADGLPPARAGGCMSRQGSAPTASGDSCCSPARGRAVSSAATGQGSAPDRRRASASLIAPGRPAGRADSATANRAGSPALPDRRRRHPAVQGPAGRADSVTDVRAGARCAPSAGGVTGIYCMTAKRAARPSRLPTGRGPVHPDRRSSALIV